MLRNNRLWFSSPMDFNDPFDCRCVYDIRNSREEIVLRKMEFLARKGMSLSDALVQAEQDIPQCPNELEEWQKQQLRKAQQFSPADICRQISKREYTQRR